MDFRQSILAMDSCEIFELTEALYTFCILWHSGQYSDLYALQCDIGSHFSPGMGFSESYVEENNSFYSEITLDNAINIGNRLLYVIENRWDNMN